VPAGGKKLRKGLLLLRKTAVLIANSDFQDAIKFFDGPLQKASKPLEQGGKLSRMYTSVQGRRMFAGQGRGLR